MDLYDRIAPFYQLEIAGYDEDIPFYLNLATRAGGPILDVGTGSGRVALALAKAGHEVVGLDSSRTMLDRAGGIRTVHADMRDFHLPETFALVLVPTATFAHLTTRNDQERALRCLRDHLSPEGFLVVALQNPYQWALDPAQDELVLGWEKDGPGSGETTRMSYAVHSERALQLRHVRVWYDVTGLDGVLRRTGVQFSLRWTFQPELELLLEGCGLRPDACYGSYDLDPYDAESPLLIAFANRQ